MSLFYVLYIIQAYILFVFLKLKFEELWHILFECFLSSSEGSRLRHCNIRDCSVSRVVCMLNCDWPFYKLSLFLFFIVVVKCLIYINLLYWEVLQPSVVFLVFSCKSYNSDYRYLQHTWSTFNFSSGNADVAQKIMYGSVRLSCAFTVSTEVHF